MAVPVLRVRNISKTFGGEHALRTVELTIMPGQVHGLLGENGSGKSTLIKILAGFYSPEAGGEMEFNGREVKLPLQPGQFRDLGMSFVHQDLALVPSLTVVENLRVGELAARKRWHISWNVERRRAREVFHRYGVRIDPAADVADLSLVDRALLAIVRAVEEVGGGARGEDDQPSLLVLDEATAALPKGGVEKLFALIREIASGGSSILFVSHDLDEVLEITDRITVLRDGQVAGTVVTAQTDETQLVEMIIGRRLHKMSAAVAEQVGRTVRASVRNLEGGPLRNLSLGVTQGEILGLTGLVGSGFEDFPYLVFGARRVQRGELVRGKLQGDSRTLMRKFDVRPPEPRATFESLSGGNQQKVVLAKWIQTNPKILLLHEPTVGVDVGARQQIFNLIRDAAVAGTAVICCSADYEQLAELCDRVLIIANGRIVRELSGTDLTKERIAEQCLTSGSGEAETSTFLEARVAGGTTD
jgi:ribose transport system ATP-binding protein